MINKDAISLIKSYGYELIREKKHFVFKHKISNQTFVCSKTASDRRSLRNIERDLKRLQESMENKMS